MTSTPPGALPVISEGTTVRFKLGALYALVTSIVGGAVFCTCFYLKVDRMDMRLQRIEQVLHVSELGIGKGPPVEPREANP